MSMFRLFTSLTGAILISTAITLTAQTASSPKIGSPQVITSPRPLSELAEPLQENYAVAITYEDPLWAWRGDLQTLGPNPRAKWAQAPANRVLRLGMSLPDTSQNLGQVLESAVTNFNAEANGGQFQVSSWELGFHIVPSKVRNENGQLTPSANLLDSLLSVPETEGTPSNQFEKICAALSSVTGTEVRFDASGIRPWLDQVFASEPPRFTWGANGVTARTALANLILKSATTLSWQLLYQASADPKDRFWVLNIRTITLITTNPEGKSNKTPLVFDRCGKCPHLSAPPQPGQ